MATDCHALASHTGLVARPVRAPLRRHGPAGRQLPPSRPRMRRELILFRVEYTMFDPGERIRPASPRCPLPPGDYVVARCVKPLVPGDGSIVFVEGRDRGVDTEYLTTAGAEDPAPAAAPADGVLAFADMAD